MSTLTLAMHGMYCKVHSRPWWVISIMAVLCVLAALESRNFRFDASADTMISQSDPELAFVNQVTDTFGEGSFLVLTYTPNPDDLFTRERLERIKQLTDDLLTVEGVTGVTSFLDVPVLQSPPVPIAELAEGFRTLLVDTSRRPRPRARELADAMGASYVPLPFADAAKISATVRSNVA